MFSFAAVLAGLNTGSRRESTRRGLARARTRGRIGGRPSAMTPERLAAATELRGQSKTIVEIAAELSVSKSTIARTRAVHDVRVCRTPRAHGAGLAHTSSGENRTERRTFFPCVARPHPSTRPCAVPGGGLRPARCRPCR